CTRQHARPAPLSFRFFFQAEDGIRDFHVTGVQTCALPIYVASGFDSVPEALRLMGLEVTLLGPEELEFGDLSQYDTIVVGIYAYRYRPDLAANNARLLEWVRNGGNLIVLNHRYTDNWDEEATPPYPIRLGRPSIEWRVTDET